MSYPTALVESGIGFKTIDTIDIREDSRANIIDDYLEHEVNKEYDLIISNPPFKQARQIINKALEDVNKGGYVVMLLRLNLFGSQKRKPFWDEQLPLYCYVHHQRMSFTKDGGTDSIEYCHMVWKKNTYPDKTKLKVI